MDSSLNLIVNKILTTAAKQKASGVHFAVGTPPMMRIDDELVELREEGLVTTELVNGLAQSWLTEDQLKELTAKREVVTVKSVGNSFRIKSNFFFQKNLLSVALRLIPERVPPLINLGLPKSVYRLAEKKSGLVIVCGPFGSGRSTTIAALLSEINKTRKQSILTIEKPIEYIIHSEKSLVEQREVGRDVASFEDALAYAHQSDVDVLFVGMEQHMAAAPQVLEFANSGRLAIATMDTASAAHAIEALYASFPAEERDRATVMLAECLQGVVCQRLLPRRGGGVVLAAEVLIGTEAVRSLIAQGRTKQLATIIQSSREEGMVSLDQSLAELVRAGDVPIEAAVELANNPENVRTMAQR